MYHGYYLTLYALSMQFSSSFLSNWLNQSINILNVLHNSGPISGLYYGVTE